MNYSKIYILGTVGSGKTTLASKLSRRLGKKVHEIDEVYWKEKYSKRRSVKDRDKLLRDILKEKDWIVEGVYGTWIEPVLKKSSVVILLDLPFRILAYRILKRYWSKKDKDYIKFSNTLKLIKYAWDYKKNRRSKYGYNWHMNLVERDDLNCILIRNNRELDSFLEKLNEAK